MVEDRLTGLVATGRCPGGALGRWKELRGEVGRALLPVRGPLLCCLLLPCMHLQLPLAEDFLPGKQPQQRRGIVGWS